MNQFLTTHLILSSLNSTSGAHFVTKLCLFQGWDDVSFHGSPQIPTPTLDGLANSGVILNNYYVSPIDSPSRAAFLTGKYALNLGKK